MKLPKKPTIKQKGLKGYQFPLENKNIEIDYVDVSQGHDNYIISKKCTHIYYVLEGAGEFELDGKVQKVKEGSMVEILPNVEFTYSGKMKLLLTMNPPWFEGNSTTIKKNPKVK